MPVPILAAVAALALAACGGGGSSPKVSAATTTTTAGRGGFRNAAFTSCLKQHGITLPAGGFGGRRPRAGGTGSTGATGASGSGGRFRGGGGFGGPPISIPGVSAAKVQTALSACRSQLPNGGRFGGGGNGFVNPAALQAYLSCLRDHGVTVPTTTSGPAPTGTGSPGSVTGRPGSELRAVRNDPKFAAANKTCQVLLPARGGATTTTTVAG